MYILGTRLAAEYPKEDPGRGIAVFASSDVRVHPQMDGLLRAVASILLVVVGLVLAIACSNLATLLLVRGTARAKEVSVRLALGATRGQLVRHLLTESLLLSVGGCIAGCLLAWWAIRSLGAPRSADRRRPEPGLPRPGLRGRDLARHRRGVRPRAGAQGHAGRPGADAARRWRDAIVGAPLAHAQERARRVPGDGVGAAAGRHQPVPPDAAAPRGPCAPASPSTASRCSKRTRATRATRRRRPARRSRSFDGASPRFRACKSAVLTRGLPMEPDWRARGRRGRDGDGRTGRRLAPGRGDLGGTRLLRRAAHSHPVRPRPRRAGSAGMRRASP